MATFTPIADGEPANAATWNARYTELAAAIAAAGPPVAQGRLTLASGDPAPLSDQTAKTTLYFTPYRGNRIALFDGAAWGSLAFAETSLALAGTLANTNYDVFGYDNGGALALELTAWASDTARATALARQNGIYIRGGNATRHYLGTIRTDAAGTCSDSLSNRYVWNNYNRAQRDLQASSAASHTYSSAVWRAWNNDTALRFHFVLGLAEEPLMLITRAASQPSANGIQGWSGLGIDTTTTGYAASVETFVNGDRRLDLSFFTTSAGYHYGQLTQFATGSVLFSSHTGQVVLWG